MRERLLMDGHVYVGMLKAVVRIYQQTFVDRTSRLFALESSSP